MIDPDYAARRSAFLTTFAAVAGLVAFAKPDDPIAPTVVGAAVMGFLAAVSLGLYQQTLDYLVDALDKRRNRRLALANKEVK